MDDVYPSLDTMSNTSLMSIIGYIWSAPIFTTAIATKQFYVIKKQERLHRKTN